MKKNYDKHLTCNQELWPLYGVYSKQHRWWITQILNTCDSHKCNDIVKEEYEGCKCVGTLTCWDDTSWLWAIFFNFPTLYAIDEWSEWGWECG